MNFWGMIGNAADQVDALGGITLSCERSQRIHHLFTPATAIFGTDALQRVDYRTDRHPVPTENMRRAGARPYRCE
jgi:hypothetical protein